ncbi:MAG: 3-deoxy-D-manno-octulosonic acid transferase [Chitinophagales bacterium]|nr:hypothetical protein [Sphingobacteriales bacterium]
MGIIYNAFLVFYYFAVWLFSSKNAKAKQWIEGRKTTHSYLSNFRDTNCLWFHASSLGEFEQISFLIETIKQKFPHEKILVTFFSPSGYEMKKNFPFADHILYLPFDFFSSIKPFIECIQPKMVFWVRYEFWLNTLEYVREKDIPLILLNGVFRNNISFLYKPYLKSCLRSFSEIAVINKSSQLNLDALGFCSTVIYDTRYSRMRQVALNPFEDKIIQHFVQTEKVVICGSIWANDDEILNTTIRHRNDIHWILAPHEVDDSRIAQLLSYYPHAQKYSQYEESKPTNILIIDCIGLLARLYRYADLAYVGGGFNKVVHSLVEPLAYSLPVIIGKNITKSEEAIDFIQLGFVRKITSDQEFQSALNALLANDNLSIRKEKEHYFEQRVDSIDKILNLTQRYISLE